MGLNKLHTPCFPPCSGCIWCIWRWLCVKSSVSAHSDHGEGWLLLSYSNWGWGPNLQFWRHISKLIGRMETWGNDEQEQTWALEWSPGMVSTAAQVKRSSRGLHWIWVLIYTTYVYYTSCYSCHLNKIVELKTSMNWHCWNSSVYNEWGQDTQSDQKVPWWLRW